MRSKLLAIDVAIAVTVALIIVIFSPGLAIAAIIAIFVLLVCAVSLLVDGIRSRTR